MDDDSTTHPDEGMIHAWLDGALDAPAAAQIAEHVRTCAPCAERVAEARGLIAGASRIVASLDGPSAGTRPGWAQSAPERAVAPTVSNARVEGSLWKWLHVTPARAAIAATILVAIGITMTRPRSGPDDVRIAAKSGDMAPRAMASAAAPAQESPATGGASDPLLDSAIKRNLEIAQPKRAMDAVRTPGVPVPEPSAPAVGLGAVDATAGTRVAEGRRELQEQRETRADVADKARVGNAAGAVAMAPAPAVAPSAENDARSEAAPTTEARARSTAMMAPRSYVGVALICYRIEGADAGAWGGEPYPLIVSTDSSVRAGMNAATVLTAAGRPTSISAQWIRGSADSVTLRLRRTGYTGSIALGPDVGGRAGTATSAPATSELERAVASRRASEPDAVSSVRKTAASASRVTMRAVSCPTN